MTSEQLETLRKILLKQGHYDFSKNVPVYYTTKEIIKAPRRKKTSLTEEQKEQYKTEKIQLFGATLSFDKSIKENTIMFRCLFENGTKKHLLENQIKFSLI